MKKLSNQSEELIRQMLIEGCSIKEIADKVNVCREVIRRRARIMGIKPFSGKSFVYKLKDCPNDLKQLVIGSLLGDGSFVKSSSESSGCCLSIGHSMKQYEYLSYKFNILKKYELVNENSIYTHTHTDLRFKVPKYTDCRFRSRVNPLFTYIRNKAYKEGKKNIDLDIIEDIDALGLAIWYMDDGSVTNKSCTFSTCSFDVKSQQRLSDFLLGRFGLHFTVEQKAPCLYLSSEDFPKFLDIVSPYILPILQYKLMPYKNRVLDKSGELLEHPNRTISSQATQGCVEGSETSNIPLEQ